MKGEKGKKGVKGDSKEAALRWGGRIATFIVSAALIYYFLRGLPWRAVWEAVREAKYYQALLGSAIPLLMFWIMDTAYTVKTFEWFDRPVRFREYLSFKAAAYLLGMINIVFSTGGTFLYFLKKTGIGARKQAGLLFFRVMMTGIGVVLVFALLAALVFIFDRGLAAQLKMGLWGPGMLVLVLVIVEWGSYWLFGQSLVLHHLPLDRGSEFWTAFREARPAQWGISFWYTAPPVFANFLGMYLIARAFRIGVPFLYFLFCIPAVAVVSALPVAFGGFGTTTAAWMIFFAAYGTRQDLAAATLFLPAAKIALRAVLAGLAMPWAMKEVEATRKAGASPDPAPPPT